MVDFMLFWSVGPFKPFAKEQLYKLLSVLTHFSQAPNNVCAIERF